MILYTPTPVLFSIGPLAIRYYSLAYILGFIFCWFALRKKYGEQGEEILVYVMLATIIGGRLGEFLFYSPSTFITDPLEILQIWHGGMSFHGAILALVLVLAWYARRRRLSFLALADTLVVPATGALVLGRIANFFNGELYGTVTNVPWCVQVSGVSGCRHPSPLYEAAYTLAIFIVLFVLVHGRSELSKQKGFLFFMFVTMYGVFRFVENFWRDDLRWLGLSTGQYLCILMVILGSYMLATKYKYRASRGKRHAA